MENSFASVNSQSLICWPSQSIVSDFDASDQTVDIVKCAKNIFIRAEATNLNSASHEGGKVKVELLT